MIRKYTIITQYKLLIIRYDTKIYENDTKSIRPHTKAASKRNRLTIRVKCEKRNGYLASALTSVEVFTLLGLKNELSLSLSTPMIASRTILLCILLTPNSRSTN